MHPQWNWKKIIVILIHWSFSKWPFWAFNHCGVLGWIQFPPSEPAAYEARFRTIWAANHWQAPRGLGEVVGHQDGRPFKIPQGWRLWGGCYTWDPQACVCVWGRKMGPLYFRQNLGWGNMSLIVGQIKSFHPPQQREMNMMVSGNLYGDVRG